MLLHILDSIITPFLLDGGGMADTLLESGGKLVFSS